MQTETRRHMRDADRDTQTHERCRQRHADMRCRQRHADREMQTFDTQRHAHMLLAIIYMCPCSTRK